MSAPILDRQVFTLSRALEFFTERELTTQIGYDRAWWPIALVKELIDNGLDACENAGRQPEICITVAPDAVTVQDSGPGLSLAILERSLDYQVRVSDKIGYVAPTRGQQGNALKTVWAAPYVIDGERGRIDVTTGGTIYHVEVALDRIAQQPALNLTTSPDGLVKNGAAITMHWPDVASCLDGTARPSFYSKPLDINRLLVGYALFNPHATITLQVAGERYAAEATDPTWRKWLPSAPTSPHWYTIEALRSLIAAYLAEERRGDRPRTVREFIAEFAGLAGTAKQKEVAELAGLTGAYLHDLISGSDVDLARVHELLSVMQVEAKVIQPQALGVLGEQHLRRRLVESYSATEESLNYRKVTGLTAGGLPWVLEVAFGVKGAAADQALGRTVVVGLNWAPTLRSPLPQLDRLLGEQRIDSSDGGVLMVHLACPRIDFTDRGKSRLALPAEIDEALTSAVQVVTKGWKAAKRQADRDDRVRQRDLDELRRSQKRRQWSVKEAAYQVMAEAYLKASANNTLPANARQIMYAARPLVLALTGGKCWKESSYFTQHLLPDYIAEYPDETAGWDVVFDARGHLAEPHTERRIDLGTLAVRRYIGAWASTITEDLAGLALDHTVATHGPGQRYHFALFIEKEGFAELLAASQIAERFDLAIMSTKGMSVTAARRLVDELSRQGVTILVLHDFDKAGFSILHTLRTDTRRYTFDAAPRVVDLGLRLADVQAMKLQSEPVEYDSKIDPRVNLAECGATAAEQRYLVSSFTASPGKWQGDNYIEAGRFAGQRVELNAMTSDQFIIWLEGKLVEHQVCKLVPDERTLATAYRRAVRIAQVQQALDRALAELPADEIQPPPGLAEVIEQRIAGTALPWDQALFELVRQPPTWAQICDLLQS